MNSSLRLVSINISNNPEGVEDRYRRLARHLEELDADLVALQEVVDPKLLQKLTAYPHLAHSSPSSSRHRHDCVAVLSKVPITEAREIVSPFPDERSFLHLQFEEFGRPLSLVTAHFPWGSRSEGLRLRQAERIDQLAYDGEVLSPEGIFLLAGDLNADEGSRTYGFLHGLDVGSDTLSSTYWTDAYLVSGVKSQWATSDQGRSALGRKTALQSGILDPSYLPPRRIDYILSHGWRYGRPGCPIEFGRFGDPLPGEVEELSDHFGIYSTILL